MQQVPDLSLQMNNTDDVDSASSSTKINTLTTSTQSVNTKLKASQIAAHEDDYLTIVNHAWDPLRCADWDMQLPSRICIARLKNDISCMFNDPPPGMFISPDPDNFTKIHALIIGPSGTPYEGGFFYFIIRCPPDYPIRPPRCRLMTTGNSTVRFNPNLYRNGKVCLSILGTWSGPAWTPAQSLSSLLISIQSLMSENPYHNEPGFEKERESGHSKAYNEIIQHETLRVAVCEMLENLNSCPKQLHEQMIKPFLVSYDYYVKVCTENTNKDNQPMLDPFNEGRGNFDYSSILKRLNSLKMKLDIDTSILEQHNQPMDLRTREIINEASALYSNLPSNKNTDFDDIFYDEQDDDDDDDDMEQSEETL
ncbi:hypothetical protein I4U23_000449 [Adineta vaga]|nr:hypothetical protein I4U23_000449 [Adineta vaga]